MKKYYYILLIFLTLTLVVFAHENQDYGILKRTKREDIFQDVGDTVTKYGGFFGVIIDLGKGIYSIFKFIIDVFRDIFTANS